MPLAPALRFGRPSPYRKTITMITTPLQTQRPGRIAASHLPTPVEAIPFAEANLFEPSTSTEAAALLRDAASNAESRRPTPAQQPADARAAFAFD